jgi:hypothetical protein
LNTFFGDKEDGLLFELQLKLLIALKNGFRACAEGSEVQERDIIAQMKKWFDFLRGHDFIFI